MKLVKLLNFIKNDMSMQHIYQPLLIRTLVESGGSATIRQLAQAVLSLDESQLLYYEKRIKEMPVRVLSKHNVVEKKGDLVLLTVGKLSLEERSQIVMLCEQSMQEFIQRKGVHIWDFRYVSDPVPGNARFQALKRANHRCDLCGVKQDDENYEERLPLHVDHIKPRSKGGSNELDNLQVLCRKCNLGKSDRDDTDFR